MPRKAREVSSTGFYHVILRGINQEAIFNKSANKRKVIYTIIEKQEDNPIEIYGYCIMNNHIHMLVRGDISMLSTFISCVSITYAMYYNRVNDRVGYVFQNRYKSYPIEKEDYFWTCLRYIHNNPVKAKLCKTPEDYKWSSFNGYMNATDILLSVKAHQFMGKTYSHIDSFTTYHQEEDFKLYPDVEEDYKMVQMRIVEHIVSIIMKKYNIENSCEIKGYKQAFKELKLALKDEAELKPGEIKEYLMQLEE